MQLKKPWFYLIGAAILAIVVKYSGSLLEAGQLLLSVMTPIFLGGAIAYVLNILVVRIERLPFLRKTSSPLYRGRRAISIFGALLIILLVVVLLIQIIIPQLVEAFQVVLFGIQPMLTRFADWIVEQELPFPQIEEWVRGLNVDWPQLFQKAMSYLTSGVGNIFTTAVSVISGVGGAVVELVIAFIFALYLLAGKERLARQFQALAETYLKKKPYNRVMYTLSTAHEMFTKFFVGQFTEAIIIGALCTVGMWILQFPYATMIGTLIGATALLPIVGAYLGAILGAFMILTVEPIQALAFLVFIVILQQLEGNLIYPRVVGSSIGLPGIWVLAAVTVGGGLGGIVGILLAVPTVATIYQLLRKDVSRRQNLSAGSSDGAVQAPTDQATQKPDGQSCRREPDKI